MLLIKNGYIKTMAGPEIKNGYILIGNDGKIISVGTDPVVLEGCTIINARGRLVMDTLADAAVV